MQLSNTAKIILLLVFSSTIFLGCGRTGSNGSPSTAPAADTPKTEPPYAYAEPETYQTEITVTSAKGVEHFLAVRKGKQWRVDVAYGETGQVTSLRTDKDKDYVISQATKTYSDYSSGHGFDERAGMIEEITRGMLNRSEKAVFEKIGQDGGLTKYKKWGVAGKDLESIVSFDEKMGLPVKMEIYKNGSAAGPPDETVQLVGFKTEADETLFAIPKDFRQVPLDEMKKVLIAKP